MYIYTYNCVIIYVYIHGIIYTYITGIFNWGDDSSSKWSKPSPSLKRDESHADPTCFWSSPDELPPASSATWTIRSLEQGKRLSKAMGLAKFLKGIAPGITLKFWKSWEVLSLGFPFSRFLPSNWHNSQSDWGLVQRHQSGSHFSEMDLESSENQPITGSFPHWIINWPGRTANCWASGQHGWFFHLLLLRCDDVPRFVVGLHRFLGQARSPKPSLVAELSEIKT